MRTITKTFIHPSDGLEMKYSVDIYAPKGTLLVSTIRGNLGHKQATGDDRKYSIELHNAITWEKMILDGVTTIPAYINRFPNADWLSRERMHVTSPRIRENFIKSRYLEQDDDSGIGNIVDFWLEDEFFKEYGYSFIESSSSTPEHGKGHPVIVFDKVITDKDYYETCLKAWIWVYAEHADRSISSCNELSFHKKGSKIHIVGNICPLSVYHEEFVAPYENHVERLRVERLRKREANKNKRSSGGTKNRYVQVASENILRDLSTLSAGSGDRHTELLRSGMLLAGFANADWHDFDTSGFQADIIDACKQNGYVADYGESSVQRTLLNWDTVPAMDEPN